MEEAGFHFFSSIAAFPRFKGENEDIFTLQLRYHRSRFLDISEVNELLAFKRNYKGRKVPQNPEYVASSILSLKPILDEAAEARDDALGLEVSKQQADYLAVFIRGQ